ncbi:hypothetical protein FKM82_030643 [Ascaphus truei]
MEARGPDSAPVRLVWSPGLDAAPVPVVALEVTLGSLGSLATLLLLTLISGLIPLFTFRRPGSIVTLGKVISIHPYLVRAGLQCPECIARTHG